MKIRKKWYITIVIISFCTTLLFLSIAYSILKQEIKIQSKVNLGSNNEEQNDYNVTYIITNKWYSNGRYYYQISMTIFNNSQDDLNGWKVSIKSPENLELIGNYDTNAIVTKNTIEFTNLSYNAQIPSKGNLTFGFQLSTTEQYYKPSNIIINGNNVVTPEEPEKPEENKNAQVIIEKENSWEVNNFYYVQIKVLIKNVGNVEINSWQFDIEFKNDTTIEQIWNATVEKTNEKQYTFLNSEYNGVITSGGEVNFGLMIKSTGLEENLEATNVIIK